MVAVDFHYFSWREVGNVRKQNSIIPVENIVIDSLMAGVEKRKLFSLSFDLARLFTRSRKMQYLCSVRS